MHRLHLRIAITAGLFLVVAGAARAQSPPAGRLHVTVRDPSGAVIVSATVTMTAADGRTRVEATNAAGEATFDLPPGRYRLQAAADGFEAKAVDVRVKHGNTREEVKLKIAKVAEQLTVGRNPREAASDARGGFESVLTPDEIAQLPDDEEELEQELKNMGGPGTVLRVNGFRGGRLPPKNQIESIRFHRNFFAADNHEPSFVTVDIITKPGFDAWRSGLNLGLRSTTLDARNPLAPEKGSGQFDRYGFNASGPLWKQHTSAALTVDGISSFESQTIFAALSTGQYATTIRQPSEHLNLDATVQQALSKTHVLRGEYQRNHQNNQDLGVGGFNLADRAYAQDTTEQLLRLSDMGPFGRHFFNDFRFQSRDDLETTTPVSEAPAVIVLSAFESGGAQMQGSTRAHEWEVADDLDITAGRHALRAGTLIDAGQYHNAVAQNANGTFTFSSLAAYEAGQPITFTERLGNPAVAYDQLEAGVYLQDDIRVTQDFTLSAGVRTEWQSHIGGVHPAPRGGFTWAPTRSGTTTIRAGGGLFYDWYSADDYAETLQVNGARQTDLVVRHPGYPDPFAGGVADEIPPGIIRQAGDLEQPRILEGLAGVQHQFAPGLMFNAIYTHRDGSHLLRSVDVNAPVPGAGRPDPMAGNIFQIESIASSTSDALVVGLQYGNPRRHLMIGGNYMLSRRIDEADTALSLPANNADLAAERGPAADDARHRFFTLMQIPLPKGVRLGMFVNGHSGFPYTITTGFDNNGDTVVNDRPAGVGRNTARGAWDVTADMRLGWTIGFGGAPPGPQGPTIVRVNAGSGGDVLGGLPGGASSRYSVELYVQAYNLLNRFNPTTYSGVMTSPFFGEPTSASPARRIEIGTRIVF